MDHVMVVLAHPEPESLCAALAAACVSGIDRSRCTATLHDLYRSRFDPVLPLEDFRRGGALDTSVTSLEKEIRNTGHLVLVFPLWWGTMPAMMQGFIQRTFSAETAWSVMEADNNAPRIQGLLGGLTVNLVITADRERDADSAEAVETIWQRDICPFAGCMLGSTLWCGPVRNAPLAARRRWIKAAEELGKEF